MIVRALAWLLYLSPALLFAASVEIENLPDLPEPVSNNAVALLKGEEGIRLYSLQGLSAGKTHADIHNKAWVLEQGSGQWQSTGPVPVETGRLASVAVSAGDTIWLFGGYTVAPDGAEVSTPEVSRLDPETGRFTHVTNMPVPVDDMTAFVYLDRYIYLVSGWHDLGNVNLVQVLDTQSMNWAQATPYPGESVFGHAGGMFKHQMLVCDGVRIQYPKDDAARQFLMSDECWLGSVDEKNFRRINWQSIPAHSGPARYRMASIADGNGNIVFSGGSANPYNYDGIGYNSEPSEPETAIFRFNLESMAWQTGWSMPASSMDHRGLLTHDEWFYLIGGMLSGQQVTGRALRFRLLEPEMP